jgi:hypothetical protein
LLLIASRLARARDSVLVQRTAGNSEKQPAASLFFPVPNGQELRISAANGGTLAVNSLEKQREGNAPYDA